MEVSGTHNYLRLISGLSKSTTTPYANVDFMPSTHNFRDIKMKICTFSKLLFIRA